MDLSQTKLTKAEWLSIEVSVTDAEKRILQLIIDGYNDPTKCVKNDAQSILSHMKISQSGEMDYYVFTTHFEPYIKTTQI